jgi:hypothetical protein
LEKPGRPLKIRQIEQFFPGQFFEKENDLGKSGTDGSPVFIPQNSALQKFALQIFMLHKTKNSHTTNFFSSDFQLNSIHHCSIFFPMKSFLPSLRITNFCLV